MFGFYVKKNFFDGWDNLWHIIVMNLFFNLVLLALSAVYIATAFIPMKALWQSLLGFFLILLSIIVMTWFVLAESYNCASIANFEKPSFKNYFCKLKQTFLPGLFLGLIIAFLLAVLFISFPYYFNMWKPSDGSSRSIAGLILMIISFWFALVCLLALQWFMPLHALMGGSFLKTLKKSFIIFLDNMGFSIAVALNNVLHLSIVILALYFGFTRTNPLFLLFAVFPAGILPGFTSILLSLTQALRLRLYKYDWIQNDMDAENVGNKNIPWDELLAHDRETLGPRTLKGIFFPWKDEK